MRGKLCRLTVERRGLADGVRDQGLQSTQSRAVVLADFAAEQVQTLNSVRAFVNRVEPVVTVVLFDVVFAGVAVSAVYLDRQIVRFKAPLRRPALSNRSQQVQQQRR